MVLVKAINWLARSLKKQIERRSSLRRWRYLNSFLWVMD